ncbi:hypothetical protein [Anaerocellum diazotrophicum]|uniref:Uncharacterized protein n=1 Tax=Caldicellulosiruptor diazotrophicus TaxID=2806205 RepID=A0ABM7NQE8_9FIRM|nr:hypothetical protein [Caldicellulosiruptor diazotrophicus]BCS82386.1 hypothetical protein CaldiYA01_23460 [Caldicellulosiruptor diazotrophicus]
MMYDTYSSLKEFIDDLKAVGEIEFEYNDKHYSLLYYDKIYICEYNKPETEEEYDTIEEFLNNYKIDGTSIKDLATRIKVIFH